MRLFWISIVISLIIGVVLLSTGTQSCPSGCHSESCAITYYDYRADDTVVFDCACDDGTCANTQPSPGYGAQLAFGIIFILYFFFALVVACGLQSKANAVQFQQQQQLQQVDLELQNSNTNTSNNPMQPDVDLDTIRPFAVNPDFVATTSSPAPYSTGGTTAAPPVSATPAPYPYSQYSALPNPAAVTSPSAPPAPLSSAVGNDGGFPGYAVAEAVHPVMVEASVIPHTYE